MDLEVIMLNEVSPRKTNTVWIHVRVESKKYMNKQPFKYREETAGYQREGGG